MFLSFYRSVVTTSQSNQNAGEDRIGPINNERPILHYRHNGGINDKSSNYPETGTGQTEKKNKGCGGRVI